MNTAARGTYTKTYSVTDLAGNAGHGDAHGDGERHAGPVPLAGGCALDAGGVRQAALPNPGATAVDACSGHLTAAISYTGSGEHGGGGQLQRDGPGGGRAGLASTAVRAVAVADTTAPVITLTGASAMTLECGSTYTEPGASASDVCTGNVSTRMTTSGTVNTAARGTYTKTYSVTDLAGNLATATRTVTVNDTLAPTLTLDGAANMTVQLGSAFVEPGYLATDACGAPTVTKTGSVNTAVAGTYTLTYTARDAVGLSTTKTRTVTVVGNSLQHHGDGEGHPAESGRRTTATRRFTLSDCAAVTTNCAPGGGGCHGGSGIDSMGEILSIYSDEVEDAQGNGDGRTDDDIVITGPSSFKLRAERQGKGNGRIYGVRFKVTDTSGASQTATCKFLVPHDQSDRQGVDDGAAAGYTVTAPNWP